MGGRNLKRFLLATPNVQPSSPIAAGQLDTPLGWPGQLTGILAEKITLYYLFALSHFVPIFTTF